MFKKRKLANNTTVALPSPEGSKNYYQPPDYARLAGVGILGVMGLLVFLWLALSYILRVAGFDDPQHTLAVGVIGLLIIGIVGAVAYIVLDLILGRVLDTMREIAQIRLEETHKHLLMAQQPVESVRGNDVLNRKLKLARLVMLKAFAFVEDHQRNYQYQDKWPWAWRNCKGLTLHREKGKVTEIEARAIAAFLQEIGAIKDNQINLKRFPDFASLDGYLRQTYDFPIVINGPGIKNS